MTTPPIMSGDNTDNPACRAEVSIGGLPSDGLSAGLTDQRLLRYSRHLLLNEIGIDGQMRIQAATVLIIGAGGLGSPVALYLAASGVGRLLIADDDTVDLTNLQRQIVHAQTSLGANKAESAALRLRAMNPEIEVEVIPQRLSGQALFDAVTRADVVLDCTDNFQTRYAINRACVAAGRALVSGAAVRFDGQVSVFAPPGDGDAPCYACLFPEGGEDEAMRCSEFGVFAPLVGIIGSVQAAEALKILMGIGTSLSSRLVLFNALDAEWREVRIQRDPGCPVCANRK